MSEHLFPQFAVETPLALKIDTGWLATDPTHLPHRRAAAERGSTNSSGWQSAPRWRSAPTQAA